MVAICFDQVTMNDFRNDKTEIIQNVSSTSSGHLFQFSVLKRNLEKNKMVTS